MPTQTFSININLWELRLLKLSVLWSVMPCLESVHNLTLSSFNFQSVSRKEFLPIIWKTKMANKVLREMFHWEGVGFESSLHFIILQSSNQISSPLEFTFCWLSFMYFNWLHCNFWLDPYEQKDCSWWLIHRFSPLFVVG